MFEVIAQPSAYGPLSHASSVAKLKSSLGLAVSIRSASRVTALCLAHYPRCSLEGTDPFERAW